MDVVTLNRHGVELNVVACGVASSIAQDGLLKFIIVDQPELRVAGACSLK